MKPVLPANFWDLHNAPGRLGTLAMPIPSITSCGNCDVPRLACLSASPSPSAPSPLEASVGSTAQQATEEKQAHLPCLEWSPNLKGNSISGSPDSQANYQIGWKGERCKALQTATDFLTVFFHISSLGWSRGGQYEVGAGRLHFEL